MGGEAYTDPRYSVVQTHKFPTKDDVGASAVVTEEFFRLPFKAKLVRFGVISAASDIVCSSSTSFMLRTEGGTELATFVPGKTSLGSGEATGCAPETATTIAKNQVVQPGVKVVGDSGSFFYFFDYQQTYDSA